MRLLAAALGLCLCQTVFGQTAEEPVLRFEVASIRPSAPGNPQQVNLGLHLDGSQARIAALPLRDYIAMAYRVKNYQVTGPAWIATDRFDISATLPEGAQVDQIPKMLQALLAERFQVQFHREQKELPVYVLMRGQRPLTLKPSAAATEESSAPEVNIAASGSSAGVSVNLGQGSSYAFMNNTFEGKRLDFARLANSLEIYMDRPLLDQTNLTGFYDVTLEITPEDYRVMLIRAGMANGVVLPPQVQQLVDNATTPSLLDAMERAGLKLDARKQAVDMIVVDQVLKSPTEN